MYKHIVFFCCCCLCCAVKNRGRYTEQNRARTESKTYIQHLQMITFCVLILLLLFPLGFFFFWLAFSISKNSYTTKSPRRNRRISWRLRIGVLDWHSEARKAEKSFSPSSAWAARCMTSASSACGIQVARPPSSAARAR